MNSIYFLDSRSPLTTCGDKLRGNDKKENGDDNYKCVCPSAATNNLNACPR